MLKSFSFILKHPIILAASIGLLPLLANPGYFNYDELQKVDDVDRFGLISYLSRYATFSPGTTFATPMRPLSFAIEGLQATLMRDWPLAVHASDIVMHCIVAFLLLLLVKDATKNSPLRIVAACFFVVGPLSVVAVGWNAALMDRLYVLFTIAAAILALRSVVGEGSRLAAVGVFIAATLAILSKETAAVAPALMVLPALFRPPLLRRKIFWLVTLAWSLPTGGLLAIKARALGNSFTSETVAFYRPSFENLPHNLLVYAGYPFVPGLSEAFNWVFEAPLLLWLAAAAQAVLVIAIWLAYSWRTAAAYLVCYWLFLLPVILLPSPGAHWMYGSSAAFSVGLAAILVRSIAAKRWLLTAAVLIAAMVGMVHSFRTELMIYQLGKCMSELSASLDASYLSMGSPDRVLITADADAPGYMLDRFLTGRKRVGERFDVTFDFGSGPLGDVPSATMRFTRDCLVVAPLK